MLRKHSAEVRQTTSLLTLERHVLQAVLFVKALQAPQAMSSETQHACWCIWWWRRWSSICRDQEDVCRAARPAFVQGAAASFGSIEIYSLSHHHVSAALKLETGLIQQAETKN